ncbi:MAG: hypothetical protein DWC11_03135 [Candidatus Poseidoniales archaeon]|nr:MAG: hypothetical protein DWC11_03135 [Candidatus Poseidoniales archaeon]
MQDGFGLHVQPLHGQAFQGVPAFGFEDLHPQVHRRGGFEQFSGQQIDGVALQKQQAREDAEHAPDENEDGSDHSNSFAVFTLKAVRPRQGFNAQTLDVAQVGDLWNGLDDEVVFLFRIEA